jgi:hypothetical protein
VSEPFQTVDTWETLLSSGPKDPLSWADDVAEASRSHSPTLSVDYNAPFAPPGLAKPSESSSRANGALPLGLTDAKTSDGDESSPRTGGGDFSMISALEEEFGGVDIAAEPQQRQEREAIPDAHEHDDAADLWADYMKPKDVPLLSSQWDCPEHGRTCKKGICTQWASKKRDERRQKEQQERVEAMRGRGRGRGKGSRGSSINTGHVRSGE